MSQTTFTLPDVIRNWPWKLAINPHYESANAESVAWLESFKPFSPNAQASFKKCKFGLLAACTYPTASFDNLRSGCDLMNAFFVIDTYTDKMDTSNARDVCNAAIDAISYPEKLRPEGENIVGEICRQFWQHARRNASVTAQERFNASWRRYLDAVIVQAERRSCEYTCTIDEYLAARLDDAAGESCIAFMEICLGVDIPHAVMEHPTLVAMNGYLASLIGLGNDLYSYKCEYLQKNAQYNAVTVVMAQLDVDLPTAIKWVSDLCDEFVDKFLKTREDILAHRSGFPSWGAEIDAAVRTYIEGLGQWLRGVDEWHFLSERYFGKEGPAIQKTRQVVLV